MVRITTTKTAEITRLQNRVRELEGQLEDARAYAVGCLDRPVELVVEAARAAVYDYERDDDRLLGGGVFTELRDALDKLDPE